MKLSIIILFTLLNINSFESKLDDKKWETIRLNINQNTNTTSKIEFTIDEDNTRVYIGIKDLKNFMIHNLHLSSPDVYGDTQWKVNRDWGVFTKGTYLDKGKYSFTVSGRTIKPTYKYQMKVRIKIK